MALEMILCGEKKLKRNKVIPNIKSKFWGDTTFIPNELTTVVNAISQLKPKTISDKYVQDDIKYIKELCKKQIKKLQGHLDKMNKLPMSGSEEEPKRRASSWDDFGDLGRFV